MHRKLRPYFPLIIVFVISFLLRSINLGSIPYGFDRDEIANAYVGRFILENGKDLYGNSWPLLFFDKFGDYPPVLPMYLSGAATYIFGLNSFSARFPAALFGSLLVFPLYFFVSQLFTKRVAIFSTLIVIILPWHLILSRASAEGILALTFCVTGLTLIWNGIHTSKRLLFIGSVILAASYLFYPAFRLLIPLILLPVPFMVTRHARKTAFMTLGLFILLTAIVASTTWGRGRFSQTSLFTNETDRSVIQNDLLRQIYSAPNQPVFLVRVFHNKYVGYTQRLIEQYFSYFSPSFWVIKGGFPERYTIPHLGLVYIWMGVFVGFTLLSSSIKRAFFTAIASVLATSVKTRMSSRE
jgi:4-amino-4-deoxy-L-arabinose transferase-like glycosyltransferase